MIKVASGHYRDVFLREVFDVFRDRLVLAGKIAKGWRFKLIDGKWSELYPTKLRAAQAARCRIASSL
jgi:hypothetical protein